MVDTTTIRPNGDGDILQLSIYPSAPAQHYKKVNEDPPDEDTTYLFNADSNTEKRDLLQLENVDLPGASITQIEVFIRCRKTGNMTAATEAREAIKTYGTEYYGAYHSITTSYVTYSKVWTNNPYTGNPWTETEINDLQAGVQLKNPVTLAKENRCTQIYVVVTYTVGVTEKNFSDSGSGSDAFVNPYRAMGFFEVGSGAEVFGIPFKALLFSDIGGGADVFNTPYREMGFSDIGGGVDTFSFIVRVVFSEVGGGSDVFAKEVITAIYKDFSDSGSGADVFNIPYKAMQFGDVGSGADVFVVPYVELSFGDVGYGADVFIIPFKAIGFSDMGSGVDSFSLTLWKAFLDYGYGAEVFAKEEVVAAEQTKIFLKIGNILIQLTGD